MVLKKLITIQKFQQLISSVKLKKCNVRHQFIAEKQIPKVNQFVLMK